MINNNNRNDVTIDQSRSAVWDFSLYIIILLLACLLGYVAYKQRQVKEVDTLPAATQQIENET